MNLGMKENLSGIRKKKIRALFAAAVLAAALFLPACSGPTETNAPSNVTAGSSSEAVPYIEVNGNVPEFTEDEITAESFA